MTMNNGSTSADKHAKSRLAPINKPNGNDTSGVDDDDDGYDTYKAEDEDEDDDANDGDTADFVPPPPATPPAIEALTATYNLQTHRWRLSTGRYVETALYEGCCLLDSLSFAKSRAPSFTVDLADPIVYS